MPIKVRLPKSQVENLKKVLALSDQKFREGVEILIGQQNPGDYVSGSDPLEAALGASGGALYEILYSMATACYTLGYTAEEFVDGLTQDNRAQGWDWFSESVWAGRTELIIGAINTPTMQLGAKARAIASDGERIVSEFKVYCDTRWVFSDSGKEIEAAIPVLRLVISHSSKTGLPQTSEYTFDTADLKELQAAVARATLKLKTMSTKLSSGG